MTDMTITLPSREERRARRERLWYGAKHEKCESIDTTQVTPSEAPKGQPDSAVAVQPVVKSEPSGEAPIDWVQRQKEIWFQIIDGPIECGPSKQIDIKRIQQVVAKHFDVDRMDILSARRLKEFAVPRQVAMYLSRKLTLRSFPEIGRRFGDRDHTTVIHGARKIARMMIADPAFGDMVRGLAKQLGGTLE